MLALLIRGYRRFAPDRFRGQRPGCPFAGTGGCSSTALRKVRQRKLGFISLAVLILGSQCDCPDELGISTRFRRRS